MKNFFKDLKQYLKKYDTVVNEYTGKIGSVSNPSLSYVEWAMKLLDEGKEDIAIEKLETATQMVVKNPEACVNLAMTYMKRGEIDKAPALLKKAIDIDSQFAKAYMAYGIYYTTIHDYKKAEHYYSIAAKIEPRLPDVFVNWAVSLVSQEKHEEAQEKFQKALFYNRNNIVGLYLWAILDIEMNLLEQAKGKLEEVLSFQPNNTDAIFYLAYIYYKQKDYEIAIRYAKIALEKKPDNPQIYGLLADSYSLNKQYDKALEIYNLTEKKHFNNEKIYSSWGHNAFMNHDFDNSIKAYKKALKCNPNSIDSKQGIALNYMVAQDYANAKIYLLEIIKECPENTDILVNLSDIEDSEKNYKKSIEYLEKAINNDVKNTKFYYKLGERYEKAGDFKKAKSAYEKMLEYSKENSDVYFKLAKLIIDENPKDALRKIRAAYNLDKNNFEYAKFYAYTLLKNEQYQNALDVIESCCKKEPYNDECLYIKTDVLLHLKKHSEVIDILYGLPQDRKNNENFDYFLLYAYILRANATNFQNDINEMNDFSYYLSQKYSQNEKFVIKLKELGKLKNTQEE